MRLRVKEDETGERLQDLLAKRLGVSKKKVKRSIDACGCRVNGKLERFGNRRLSFDDRVAFSLMRTPEKIEENILFEDDWIKVINKSCGMVSESSVHRLDKPTSGVLLFAKQKEGHLIQQFRERSVEKEYIAVVQGVFPDKEKIVKNKVSVRCRFDGGVIWGSDSRGKEAETHFTRLRYDRKKTLIRCQPITGRTHQIRVHLSELGYPVLGDHHYHREKPFTVHADRLMLHAHKLTITHPETKERMTFEAPVPEAFPWQTT